MSMDMHSLLKVGLVRAHKSAFGYDILKGAT